MMGPWLGVGACSNMLSASSSVSGGGGRGGARLPYCPEPLGGGGRGGASPSEGGEGSCREPRLAPEPWLRLTTDAATAKAVLVL